MTEQDQGNSAKLNKEQRLTAYQNKLNALKERSALREVMERELLFEFIRINHGNINEYPLLKAQQNSVVELLSGRAGHPGYEFIHSLVAHFIVQLAHYGKAVKVGDTVRIADLQTGLINTESILIKCVQGIVYAMALITDNFEELVLRYFGQEALHEYSSLIEKFELNASFWKAFVKQFIASRVEEAHKEIIDGEKYNISKEKNFLVIRFLFDDILAKLNPTGQVIEKTRIQKSYVNSRTEFDGRKQAKIVQTMLVKGLAGLSQVKTISANEFLQAARTACIDPVAGKFEKQYQQRIVEARASQDNPGTVVQKDPVAAKQEQIEFKFLLDQIIALGVGAAIAIGMTSDHLYKALEAFVPDQIKGIKPLAKDFSIPTLEKILYFLLENHTIHILKEAGRDEGGKIQVRSGRARRVHLDSVDALPGISKIRKKQIFANDVTRENMLLFKPKTAKQMAETMSMLNLEPELQKEISILWKDALFRVDIMVLINLELVARTTTNLTVKLSEILGKYGLSKPSPPPQKQDQGTETPSLATEMPHQ